MQYQGKGYGLSDAVGGFFGTYFKAKEMRMKEDQFNRNMAEEQRQFSLLQAVKESELLRQRQSDFITPKEGDIYTKYGLPAGQEIPIQLADNLLSLANPKTKETKVTTSMVRQGNKFITYEHEEGASPSSGKIIGESPIREGSSGTNESPELLEDWKPTALVTSLGKSKKIYPYSEVGMSRLIDDVTNDKKLSMYAKKLIKENNIQDSETLSREIRRHTQNKWYQGGKGFTDEQILRLDKLTEVFGQFVEKRNELGR